MKSFTAYHYTAGFGIDSLILCGCVGFSEKESQSVLPVTFFLSVIKSVMKDGRVTDYIDAQFPMNNMLELGVLSVNVLASKILQNSIYQLRKIQLRLGSNWFNPFTQKVSKSSIIN